MTSRSTKKLRKERGVDTCSTLPLDPPVKEPARPGPTRKESLEHYLLRCVEMICCDSCAENIERCVKKDLGLSPWSAEKKEFLLPPSYRIGEAIQRVYRRSSSVWI
jgi:hypothetical protein